jgi:hypothetical protein
MATPDVVLRYSSNSSIFNGSKVSTRAGAIHYRGQITRLFEYGQIQFFTSYCSDVVGKSKSNRLSVKLDEYFSDPEVDNCFSLSKPCPSGTSHSTAIRAFLALSVLYIACRACLAGKSGRSLLEKNLVRVA